MTKTLPADGTAVPVTFEVNGDTIIFEILVDNHPSDDAGVCTNTGGTPIQCTESDHRLVSMTIDGDDFRPGVLPTTLASNDRLSIRPLFAQIVGSDVHLPLSGRSEFVMVFDTENGVNDVVIEVTLGFIGGQGANLD